MFSIRARTFSGLSSFLACSLVFSGSRYPSAHWPSPRFCRGRPDRPGPLEPGPAAGFPVFGASLGGVTRRCAPGMRDATGAAVPTTSLSRCHRGPHARLGSGAPHVTVRLGSDGAPGRTDHAAGTAEVHVASYHEVLLGCRADHGRKSHARDAGPPNHHPDM